MNFRIGICGAVVLGILFATAAKSFGQTNAVQDGNWSDPATWDSGVPDPFTPATVNGGLTVTIDQMGPTTQQIDLGTIEGETGNLNITGGDLFVFNPDGLEEFPSAIRVGQMPGSSGNLTMSGGLVFIDGAVGSGFGNGDLLIGDNGAGTMTMTGGQLLANDEVFLGLQPGSSGSLNVSGGTMEVLGRNLLVGFSGSGDLNLSGTGTIDVAGFLFSSFWPTAPSNITQSGGTLISRGPIVLARQGDSTFDHTGGAIETNVFIVADNFPANFDVFPYTPHTPGAEGTYNISGDATLDVSAITWLGAFGGGHGTINQTGGTVNTGAIGVGRDGRGTWNMEDGVLNQTGSDGFAPNNHLIVGQVGFRDEFGENITEGSGFFHQTGGDVTVTTGVFLGNFNNSEGTYKISGGTLNVTGTGFEGTGMHPNPEDFKSNMGNFSVGGALASNALRDDLRVDPTSPTDPQGQALGAKGTFIVSGSAATINIAGNFLANPADKHEFRRDEHHVNGDNSATLVFEIFDNSGTSLIDVAGVADLDGAVIDLNLMGGFTPAVGTVFDLLAASSFGATGTGTTQNVGTGRGFTLAPEDVGVFDLDVVSIGGREILQATFLAAPVGVIGDYNENGVVDAADYTIWRDNLGANIALPNEGATPGMVTQEDYDVWKANFGNTAPGAAAVAAVPEPSAAILLLGIAVGALWFRSRSS